MHDGISEAHRVLEAAMNIKALIIDDSLTDLQEIDAEMKKIFSHSDINVESVTETVPDDELFKVKYDLVILDIDMPEISGFDIAENLTGNNPELTIMFCTAHDEFVYEAFDYNVFFFIRKQHLHDDMNRAIQKYVQYLSQKQKKYLLQNNSAVEYNHIMYFEISGNDVYIYTDMTDRSGDTIYFKERISLKKMTEQFSDEMFFQITQTHIINMQFIAAYSRGEILLKNTQKFTVSRRRLTDFEKAFTKWSLR